MLKAWQDRQADAGEEWPGHTPVLKCTVELQRGGLMPAGSLLVVGTATDPESGLLMPAKSQYGWTQLRHVAEPAEARTAGPSRAAVASAMHYGLCPVGWVLHSVMARHAGKVVLSCMVDGVALQSMIGKHQGSGKYDGGWLDVQVLDTASNGLRAAKLRVCI